MENALVIKRIFGDKIELLEITRGNKKKKKKEEGRNKALIGVGHVRKLKRK